MGNILMLDSEPIPSRLLGREITQVGSYGDAIFELEYNRYDAMLVEPFIFAPCEEVRQLLVHARTKMPVVIYSVYELDKLGEFNLSQNVHYDAYENKFGNLDNLRSTLDRLISR